MTVHVLTPVERPEPSTIAPAAPTGHRTWNRFELKYLVPVKRIPELMRGFAGYLAPDANGGDYGYPVYSVYWDSPSRRFFWEKVDGEKVRRKLRFRTYETGGDVFVEIKQRIDRTVQKRRITMPLGDVRRWFDAEWPEGGAEAGESQPVLSEVLCMRHEYNLRPCIAVGYRRKAWFGVFEPELRITFDTRVQYSASELDIGEQFETGKYMLDPRLAIMEVKFNHRLPVWLVRAISRFDLSAIRISKYCSAVDRAYYGHQYT
jgi:hypothetical protein